MKRRLLFVSMCFPYDKVAHAGGKTFHYYVNAFAKDKENEVTLIAKVLKAETEYTKALNKKIRFLPVATPENKLKKYWGYLKSLNSKCNPKYKYGNTLTKEIYDQIKERLKELKREGYTPEIIILEWTEMLLFVEEVKKIFPDAKYVASEHDVSFLRIEREMEQAENPLVKYYKWLSYKNIQNRELTSIENCDLVVTHNWKDYNLLRNHHINEKKLGVIVPYYDKFPQCDRKPNKRDIIFYGAMNRVENSSAAIWFIEKVLPLLSDCEVRFLVIGNKPPKELLQLQDERILVTGFVEDTVPYFSTAMCMVAPLLLGAGVKVKIIEALSAGIPVLTNDIGIEGIDAEDGLHYFHCVKPKEYERTIRKLINGETDSREMSFRARRLINEKYNLEEAFRNYSNRMYSLQVNKDL